MWCDVVQGIISGSLGHWSGSGFTFHAWTCLEATLTGAHVHTERPLYRYWQHISLWSHASYCKRERPLCFTNVSFFLYFLTLSLLTSIFKTLPHYFPPPAIGYVLLRSESVRGAKPPILTTFCITYFTKGIPFYRHSGLATLPSVGALVTPFIVD